MAAKRLYVIFEECGLPYNSDCVDDVVFTNKRAALHMLRMLSTEEPESVFILRTFTETGK